MAAVSVLLFVVYAFLAIEHRSLLTQSFQYNNCTPMVSAGSHARRIRIAVRWQRRARKQETLAEAPT